VENGGGAFYWPALRSWLEPWENVFLSWPRRVFTVAMIATEMPAAMRPYSIAVAPLSSRRKRLNTDMLLSKGYRQSPADTVARYRGELPRMSKREPPDFHG